MPHYLLSLPLWLGIGLPVGAVVATVLRRIVRALLEEFQTLLDQIVP